jgi:hypothetical protein
METVVDGVPWPRYADAKVENWQEIHDKLVGFAKRQAGHDFEEGQWLLRGMKAAVHVALAYGSYFEYVERIFGYAPRVAADRIRVAQALEELPLTAEALRTGDISWSIAREVTRVAVAETEREWLDAVRSKRVRQVEGMVSGRSTGDRPTDPPDESARRHVVRFEVGGDVLALLREAKAELVRRTGGHLQDDDVVRLLASTVLGGPGDEGRAAYQIAMTICRRCGAGKQEGCGEAIPVTDAVVERACCDAQHIGSTQPQSGARVRASQSIPPAVRREVVRRHGGRCAVPGCCNAIVEVHHLDRRAEGGTHDPRRLLPLCSAHHAAEHDGRLIIEGDPEIGFRFFHADRTPYGSVTASGSTIAWGDAFCALKNLGYKEGESRAALEAVRPKLHVEADTQTIIRAALRHLARGRRNTSERRPSHEPPRTPVPPERRRPAPPEASPTPPCRDPGGSSPTRKPCRDPGGSSPTRKPCRDPEGSSPTRKPCRDPGGSSPTDDPGGSSPTDDPRGPSPTHDPRGPSPTHDPRGPSPTTRDPRGSSRLPPVDPEPFELARSALVNLGFSRDEARAAVERAGTYVKPPSALDVLIRAALREVPAPGRARDGELRYEVDDPPARDVRVESSLETRDRLPTFGRGRHPYSIGFRELSVPLRGHSSAELGEEGRGC